MRKLLSTIFWFFAAAAPALAHSIDSLKKLLPARQDTALINVWNQLSYAYVLGGNKDSAEYYGALAYAASQKRNYRYGLAQYYTCKAGIVKHFNDDFRLEEMYARSALQWYELTPDKRDIQTPYYQLGFALFAQSRFKEAIGYLQQSYDCSKKVHDTYGMFRSYSLVAAIYREGGNYDRGFYYSQRCLQMAQQAGHEDWEATALFGLGELYMLIEDYPIATTYFRKAFTNYTTKIASLQVDVDYDIWVRMEFAELFSLQHQFDSALHYYNQFDSAHAEEINLRVYLVSKGEYFLLQQAYYKSLHYFLQALPIHQKLNDRNQVMRTLLDIARAYYGLHFNIAALKYAQEGLQTALQTNAKQFIRDGYKMLYLVHDRWGDTDSAYLYFRQYINMKEVIANDQIKAGFSAYNYQQQINLLNKAKEIQQARLEKEMFLKRILSMGFFIFLLLSFIIFRNITLRQKNEAHRHQLAENELQIQKLESQKQLSHLKMQALRAQMSPHFIFNCLNAINHFILKNQVDEASDYLTKFSRLIRLALNNSNKNLITLKEEIDCLHLYIQLERLRFNNAFAYHITCPEAIDGEEILIPPLLLQPFVENAIWHGLMHKEGEGALCIELQQDNDQLICRIKDNGIGRKTAAELEQGKTERKSLGLHITEERMKFLVDGQHHKAHFQVVDLEDADGHAIGTEVILTIPVKSITETKAVYT